MKREVPQEASPYYPPRARWYGRFRYPWCRLRHEVRRGLRLERFSNATGLPLRKLLLCLLVPGYAFAAFGHRLVGRLVLGVYGAAAGVFVLGIGFDPAHVNLLGEELRFQPTYLAFGLMIATHAMSATHLLLHYLQDFRFLRQVGHGLAVTAFFTVAIYFPALRVVEAHWVVRLQVHGRVVLVSRLTSAQSVRRGDWVAYRIVASEEGYALGEVLGTTGDRIRFAEADFEVNGVRRQRRGYMPTSGVAVVRENYWFIWPDLRITVHGMDDERVAERMLQLALVHHESFVGKPLERWFLRRKTMP